MINLTTLASKLETKLNGVSGNVIGTPFRVFAGTGKYIEAVENDNTITETINCVLSVVSNDMTVLNNGLIFATQTCSLRVIIPLEDTEENESVDVITGFDENNEPVEGHYQTTEGNAAKIAKIRGFLDNEFSSTTNENMTEGTSPAPVKTYSVSTIYTLMDDGERDLLPTIGYSYSLNAYIYYYFVENGISSRSNIIKIDGVVLPCQVSTQYRTPTMDGYVPADTTDGTVENIASQSQSTISVTLPVFSGDNAVQDGLDYLLDGKLNVAHIVELTIGTKAPKYFLAAFGEISMNAETVKNLGMTLAVVPCCTVYELVKIPTAYKVYLNNGSSASIVTLSSPFAFDFGSKQFPTKVVSGTTVSYTLTVGAGSVFMSLLPFIIGVGGRIIIISE